MSASFVRGRHHDRFPPKRGKGTPQQFLKHAIPLLHGIYAQKKPSQ